MQSRILLKRLNDILDTLKKFHTTKDHHEVLLLGSQARWQAERLRDTVSTEVQKKAKIRKQL